MFQVICPSCGVEHEIDLAPNEEYDDLCLQCEEEWVNSYEYAVMLGELSR